MKKTVKLIKKGVYILAYRLLNQGVRTTLAWGYGRGVPKITGVPWLRFSRVTPHIYVGPQYRAAGKRKLEALGINAGVNLRIEFDDAAHGLAFENYCYLPTVDDDAPAIEHLQEGVAFIGRVVAGGGRVYIHCAGGVGRAPTMAAAYFMSEGYTLDEALALIRRVRPFIKITPPQLAQLQRFEALVRETAGVSL